MKKTIVLIFASAAIFTLCACSNMSGGTYIGKEAVETRSFALKDFKNFECSNDIDVSVTRGDEYSVKVTTNKDVFDKLEIKKQGDTLVAKNKPNIVLQDTIINMEVVCPEVVDINLSNDSDVVLDGDFKTQDNVKINISNDASLIGSLSGKDVDITVSNDGQLDISGSFNNSVLSLSNDGAADLSQAMLNSAVVNISNDAKLDINAQGNIELTASNSPRVNVYGGNIIRKAVDEDVVINMME